MKEKDYKTELKTLYDLAVEGREISIALEILERMREKD